MIQQKKIISLIELPLQVKAKIVEIAGGVALQNRFMSMGLYPGREIVKVSHSILRGPVAIKVGRSILALGYGMARKIIVAIEA